MEKVAGSVLNQCKQCGQTFAVVYYEDETEEAARRNYCLACILGIEERHEAEASEDRG